MKSAVLIMFGALFLLAVAGNVRADIISPGHKPIEVNNYIGNINDFPEYAFFSIGKLGEFGANCPVKVVGGDGKIGDYYKFCSVYVYAVKKDKLNENYLNGLNSSEWEDYLVSDNVKKVIDGIDSYEEVPVTSTQEVINNYYSVDLSKVKTEPDNVDKERNYLIYVYLGIGIIALAVIIILIARKMRR